MKAAEQQFPVVLFIMLYKVILTLGYVNEILKCDHSDESYRAVLQFPVLFPSWGSRSKETLSNVLSFHFSIRDPTPSLSLTLHHL